MSMQIPHKSSRRSKDVPRSGEAGSASPQPCSYSKAERIRKSIEFKQLSRLGKRHYSSDFIIITRRNPFSRSRLGITVSKKVGKAVTRNRIKRIIREYFRLNRSSLPVRSDINVIARKAAANHGKAVLRAHLQQAMDGLNNC